MLDFRMETLLTVCNDMNFTHAAEHLNLTQPAVSQHIKHLEKTYGTELFIRDKKKLRLTPAGEILRSALETMRNDENTLKKRMQESIEEKKVLTFGVTMTIGEYAIVPALSRFIKTHPDMDFHIRYGNTQTLLTYLHEGTIDFAIVEGYFSGDHYETRVYKTEEYIAVSSAHHTFSKPVFWSGLPGYQSRVLESGDVQMSGLGDCVLVLKICLSKTSDILWKSKTSTRSSLC